MNLDGGLLSKAKGFDGSTLAITYDQRILSFKGLTEVSLLTIAGRLR